MGEMTAAEWWPPLWHGLGALAAAGGLGLAARLRFRRGKDSGAGDLGLD